MRRLRVLQVIPDLSMGGAERMAVHLVRHLDPNRFETGIVSFYDPVGTDLDDVLAREQRRVWYLGKQRGFDRRLFGAIHRVFRNFRPDIVHTHTITLRYTLPSAVLCRTRARLHTIHNTADREAGRWGWIRKIAFRLGFVPVAIADEVQRGVSELYGIHDCPNIPNGIPLETYTTPRVKRDAWRAEEGFEQSDLLFVTIGRPDPQKNHSLAIQALERVRVNHQDAFLLIVGRRASAETQRELDKLARACGVADRVRFLGSRTDIPEILSAADVFMLSSDYEGNPLTVMEAMAAGRPVVSTAVGGVPELVQEGVTGFLAPAGDAQRLAGAMSKLSDAALRRSMGEAGARRAVERFGVSKMADSYGALYEKLAGVSRS